MAGPKTLHGQEAIKYAEKYGVELHLWPSSNIEYCRTLPTTHYYIANATSGVSLGVYEATSRDEALDLMAVEAGYRDHAAMIDAIGTDAAITILDVDDCAEYHEATVDGWGWYEYPDGRVLVTSPRCSAMELGGYEAAGELDDPDAVCVAMAEALDDPESSLRQMVDALIKGMMD